MFAQAKFAEPCIYKQYAIRLSHLARSHEGLRDHVTMNDLRALEINPTVSSWPCIWKNTEGDQFP